MAHPHSAAPSWGALAGLALAAAAVNACGWVFGLWREPVWYDEAVHLFTSFVVGAAIGRVLLAHTGLSGRRVARVTLLVAALGLGLGVAWEVFEWAIGEIGSARDTAVDLLMDTAGAGLGGALAAWRTTARGREVGA